MRRCDSLRFESCCQINILYLYNGDLVLAGDRVHGQWRSHKSHLGGDLKIFFLGRSPGANLINILRS